MEEKPKPASPPPSDPATPADRFRAAAGSGADARDVESEEVLWEGTYSAKAMYGSWLLAILLTIAGAIAAFLLLEPTFAGVLVTIGVLVVWGGLALTLLFRKWNISYQLTNQRLIHRRGVLKRVTDRIEVIDIDDVTFAQGIVQRMLGVGNVRISSTDRTHPELTLIGIDRVEVVADLIDNVRRRERRRRGLHIEAI